MAASPHRTGARGSQGGEGRSPGWVLGASALLLALGFGRRISTVVILLGAELDAEMEHQTARDTTEGNAKPLGARGAMMADQVGKAEG